MEYTKEQLEDVRERGLKADEFLKSIDLSITANVQPVIISTDPANPVFAFSVRTSYADLKFAPKPENTIEEAKVAEKPKKK